jgi:tetratricopeptide (TPR) repeat protein
MAVVAPLGAQGDALQRADDLWAARGAELEGEGAAPAAVLDAIALYESALRSRPDDLEATWKLLRALHFRAEHTAVSASDRKQIYRDGRDLVEAALRVLHGERKLRGREPAELAAELGTSPEGAAVHFWAAMIWGLWGDTEGALAAVRKGVAKRIRLHAEVAVLLDESFEEGGGYRFLGRLHAEAPKVPLFTGWVDRDEAVRLLEKAVEMAPQDPFNRLYLAEALLSFRRERSSEALGLLEQVVAEAAAGEARVEQLAAKRAAAELLREHSGS